MGDFGPSPYDNLPEDPEEAFLELEAHFRYQCERDMEQAGRNNERTDVICVAYMAQVVGAINALELEAHSRLKSLQLRTWISTPT
ncbi:MAG TPA: hypothetical protein VHW24_07465 [Bryobacteraceae bacterium]|jgi:hypothetical protein|nr:hypothetical protein [Bryobacteraceae bacterium]